MEGRVGELVGIRFSEHHRTGLAQGADEGGVPGHRRGVVAAGAATGRHAGDVDDVLDRDRDPVERSAVPTRAKLAVEALGLGAGLLAGDVNERIEAGAESIDAPETGVDEFAARDGARAQQRADPANRLEGQIVRAHGNLRCTIWLTQPGPGLTRPCPVACSYASAISRRSRFPLRRPARRTPNTLVPPTRVSSWYSLAILDTSSLETRAGLFHASCKAVTA